jgi:hypothetical protein
MEDDANIIKKPFVNYTLDEDKIESDSQPLVVRINKTERIQIDELKRLLNYGQDAKVIKAGLIVLKNVIHGTFGPELMQKITNENRRRPIFEDAEKSKE